MVIPAQPTNQPQPFPSDRVHLSTNEKKDRNFYITKRYVRKFYEYSQYSAKDVSSIIHRCGLQIWPRSIHLGETGLYKLYVTYIRYRLHFLHGFYPQLLRWLTQIKRLQVAHQEILLQLKEPCQEIFDLCRNQQSNLSRTELKLFRMGIAFAEIFDKQWISAALMTPLKPFLQYHGNRGNRFRVPMTPQEPFLRCYWHNGNRFKKVHIHDLANTWPSLTLSLKVYIY
jgi:hypothetical protein